MNMMHLMQRPGISTLLTLAACTLAAFLFHHKDTEIGVALAVGWAVGSVVLYFHMESIAREAQLREFEEDRKRREEDRASELKDNSAEDIYKEFQDVFEGIFGRGPSKPPLKTHITAVPIHLIFMHALLFLASAGTTVVAIALAVQD